MRRLTTGLVGGAAVALLAATALQPAAAVTVPSDGPTAADPAASPARSDNRPGPRTKQWIAQRQAALEKVASGALQPDARGVVKLGKNKFVELRTQRADTIFTILADFGTTVDRKLGTVPGPVHNDIPEPDRTVDNSTYWEPDFSKAYYENLFNGPGESMRTYYEQLSSGRYTVSNVVSDWVTVPGNASYYGDNAVEDTGGAWRFVGDAANAWYAAQVKARKTPAQIKEFLQSLDTWDRYDFDGDGNFTEPDGYIDHFQAVHAGEGEEAGADSDAIWSHRWYAFPNLYGTAGPTVGGTANLMGGTQIGSSGIWLGDYTVEPENGGLGVFVHEFAHDLGLPDYYDTAGGENSTSFWTLMSSGSWLSHGAENGIGTTPGLMGAEEKLFLGWLDHVTVPLGSTGTFTLNPSQGTVRGKEQAVRINLPDRTTSKTYTTPPSGPYSWWTGSADDLNETLTWNGTVPAARKVTVSAKAWYDIEAGYDYLYAEYSTDNGVTWKRAGTPVDGSSRGRWTTLSWSYSPGGASKFRLRYQTDGGVHLTGAFLDDIAIGGTTDPVDQAGTGWTHAPTDQWQVSTGTVERTTEQYYLLESRQYVGYDATLQNGPYQFGYGITAPNRVQTFPFQNGMLVWYVNDEYEDNNTSEHPGAGAALPVDARPEPFTYDDGSRPSNRRQPLDATFGKTPTDVVCLDKEVLVRKVVETWQACAPVDGGIPVFDDSNEDAYYSTANPLGSVKVAGHGVTATVVSDAGDTGGDLVVEVVNPAG